MSMTTRTLEKACAAFSILAGGVHGLVAPAHLEEWWGYGLFFLSAAAFQVLFGVALVTRAINPTDFGAGAHRARRILLVAGIAANVAILLLYVVTRTIGIPWFGPEAGTVEDVGPLDIVASVAEAAVIAVGSVLFFRSVAQRRQSESA